jgi:hypothetical protein
VEGTFNFMYDATEDFRGPGLVAPNLGTEALEAEAE